MRTVPFVRRVVWLAILIAALPQIGAMAQSTTLLSEDVLFPSRPVAPNGSITVAQAIAQPQEGLTIPGAATATTTSTASVLARRPPHVRSFALLPQLDGHTAQLRIEFSKDVRLPREFELQLDKAIAVLRPTADNVATTRVEFDVDAFLQEQATRSEYARRGALVPVFSGRHFKGFDRVRFLDPEQVRTAIRLKRFISIPAGLFDGIPAMVDPSRELMITDLSVVEDRSRTFDVCTGAGARMGAWTFGKLFTDMANGMIDPAKMLEDWLNLWLSDQRVNTFKVPARAAGMRKLLLNDWPRLNGRLDLDQAPMRLLAIVNRVDLRKNAVYGGGAGEARFVFGVIDRKNCQSPPPFTIILEYGIPRSGCTAIHDWAKQWHALGSIALGTAYNDALQKITDQFAGRNTAPSKPNASALNQLRTNENALNSLWELREFRLDPNTHKFIEATVAQTPDLGFNLTPTLKNYINTYKAAILNQKHEVPDKFEGDPFVGGNAPNNFMFWNSSPEPSSYDARHFFSLSTCNGCHGRETNTSFTHINTRQAGSASGLSKFLVGQGSLATPTVHQVTDPVVSTKVWDDGDLLRRQQDLAALLGSSCASGGFLPAIAFQPLNAPH